mmetsp:Transcript_14151/g.28593  ORF Transcript_14151/g.28593 Transcript_14151/m.28593 type:complete len:255 (-) Transcript_14151:688-1452(-)
MHDVEDDIPFLLVQVLGRGCHGRDEGPMRPRQLQDLLRRLRAAHLRHVDVREHDDPALGIGPQRAPSLLYQLFAVDAVDDALDVHLPQPSPQEREAHLVVLRDEQPRARRQLDFRAAHAVLRLRRLLRMLARPTGDADRHGRALVELALDVDAPLELLHRLLDDGEPQARAAVVADGSLRRLLIRLEDRVQLALRDATAGVLHLQDDAVRASGVASDRTRANGHGLLRLGVGEPALERDEHLALGWRELDGVGH